MLKVVIQRTRDPDTLHYVSGTLVRWNGKRNDLLEPEVGEAIVTRAQPASVA
jgi:hypothetical protein